MEIKIEAEEAGRSVLDILRGKLHVSARLLARLKRCENGITVNGERVTVRRILCAGDLLCIEDFPEEGGAEIKPVDLPLDIVFEDEYFLVADKPPFMPTHPSHDHYDDTVANALAYRFRSGGVPFVFRPVSRLDRNTSGLITIAKTKYASSLLNSLMWEGGFEKTYTAIIDGVPPSPRGGMRGYIRRTPDSIITREVCPSDAPGAERALTLYEVIYSEGGHSIVKVSPRTGRTHQIRVHFAHAGTPVTGDDLYGGDSRLINRHALHASALSFIHPISGDEINLASSLPRDMRRLAAELFPGSGRLVL